MKACLQIVTAIDDFNPIIVITIDDVQFIQECTQSAKAMSVELFATVLIYCTVP